MSKKAVGTKRIKKPYNWDIIYRGWEQKKIKSKDAILALGLTSYGFYTLVKQQKEIDKPKKQKERTVRESWGAWKMVKGDEVKNE